MTADSSLITQSSPPPAESWRSQILREFTPQAARLTLVADPDGLLLEEGVLERIRERGFELIPFEDHVTFLYAYESRFRSRWDHDEKTDLVVVLRSPASDLDTLPYDLLQAGRKLSLSLGDLFPNLSYPVIAALNRTDLDALFDAQIKHTPGQLGDNATKDFVLRHVFEIAPELIKEPKDLLRILLRRHHHGQRIPAILDERFIQVLRQYGLFEDWPLETIIPDREAFFAFLQERWPVFLDSLAQQEDDAVHEDTSAYLSVCGSRQTDGFEFAGPALLPFDHDDIRIYIDNLFLEGLLKPIPHEQAEALARTWVAYDIQEGLKLLSHLPREDHMAVHWGMIMTVYPFWGAVATQVGRLLRLQGIVNHTQIRRRIMEQYGQRPTVKDSVRRVLRSMVDWRVLQDALTGEAQRKDGTYVAGHSRVISQVELIAWLAEAFLHAHPNGPKTLRTVLEAPNLFPFHIASVSADHLVAVSGRLDLFLDGLNQELLMLRTFNQSLARGDN